MTTKEDHLNFRWNISLLEEGAFFLCHASYNFNAACLQNELPRIAMGLVCVIDDGLRDPNDCLARVSHVYYYYYY